MLKHFDLSLLGTFPFCLSCASAAKFVFPAQLTAQSGPLSLSLPLNADLLSSGSRRRDAPGRCVASIHSGACLGEGHDSSCGASRLFSVGAGASWLGDTLCLCVGEFCGCSVWLNSTRTAFEVGCVSIISASCFTGTSATPEPVCFRDVWGSLDGPGPLVRLCPAVLDSRDSCWPLAFLFLRR